MEWDEVRLHWPDLHTLVRQRWPRLTADDVDLVAGSRRYLIEVVQERYRCPDHAAASQVDALLPSMMSFVGRLDDLHAWA